jgi:chromosome segregation ATPase
MTDLWDEVLKVVEQQRAKGLAKYGKPVTADAAVDWLQHAIEEQLDAAVYMQAAKAVLDAYEKELQFSETHRGQFQEQVNLCESALAKQRQEIADLMQELELVSDQRDRIAAAGDDFEDRLKATKADLLKLAEEKEELLTACEEWERMYSEETAALETCLNDAADLKAKDGVLRERIAQLEFDLEFAKTMAEKRFQQRTDAENRANELQNQVNWRKEQQQHSEALAALLLNRLQRSDRKHWLSCVVGLIGGSAISIAVMFLL